MNRYALPVERELSLSAQFLWRPSQSQHAPPDHQAVTGGANEEGVWVTSIVSFKLVAELVDGKGVQVPL